MSIDTVGRDRYCASRRPPLRSRAGATVLAAALAALLAAPTVAEVVDAGAPARYTIVDLGPLPTRSIDDKPGLGADGSAALWRVVGGSTLRTQFVRGFTAVDLGTLAGHPNTIATDMNDSSTIVGIAQAADDIRDTQAFIWLSGRMAALPTLGGRHAAARALNRVGHVAGIAQTASGELRAVRWEDGSAQALKSPAGWGFSEAFAIAGDDEVVGDADVSHDGRLHAVLWSADGAHDLGTLPGGTVSSARAINERHQIVGFSDEAENELRAVIWLPEAGVRDLGSLGALPAVALDINDAGQVVGMSGAAKGPPQAFLWEDGRMRSLASLVASDARWRLATAYRVNARGEILGHGYLDGESRAFLLRPIPMSSAR